MPLILLSKEPTDVKNYQTTNGSTLIANIVNAGSTNRYDASISNRQTTFLGKLTTTKSENIGPVSEITNNCFKKS